MEPQLRTVGEGVGFLGVKFESYCLELEGDSEEKAKPITLSHCDR